jgi:WD40 repeat protein
MRLNQFSSHILLLFTGMCLFATTSDVSGQQIEHRATLEGHIAIVTSASFKPNGNILVSGGGLGDNTIRHWNGQSMSLWEGQGSAVRCLAFNPAGDSLATGGDLGILKIWSVANPQQVRRLDGDFSSSIWNLAISPDGKLLAVGLLKSIELFHFATGKPVTKFAGPKRPGIHIPLAFSPDGAFLASGGTDNALQVWDIGKRGPFAARYAVHKYGIASLAFSPDGRWVVSGAEDKDGKGGSSPDGEMALWTFPKLEKVAVLSGHAKAVNGLAFHKDGKWFVSASSDGTVRVWDLAARREIASLKGHTGPVWCVAFSPDGKTLATGGDDKTIRLWDVK